MEEKIIQSFESTYELPGKVFPIELLQSRHSIIYDLSENGNQKFVKQNL